MFQKQYYLTSVAIKHTEERASVANVNIGNIGVLHGLAPALHATGCEAYLEQNTTMHYWRVRWPGVADEAKDMCTYSVVPACPRVFICIWS